MLIPPPHPHILPHNLFNPLLPSNHPPHTKFTAAWFLYSEFMKENFIYCPPYTHFFDAERQRGRQKETNLESDIMNRWHFHPFAPHKRTLNKVRDNEAIPAAPHLNPFHPRLGEGNELPRRTCLSGLMSIYCRAHCDGHIFCLIPIPLLTVSPTTPLSLSPLLTQYTAYPLPINGQ